uniref:Ig-like domain-containing protein n=1 Tax=Electrophorus electricus TaxID=8005 RepID=A0A4W4EBT5_ELEEL
MYASGARSFILNSKSLFLKWFSVLGPSGPVAVQLGGSVMLPCYVQNPIPVEELEVEWRRTDPETLGEIQPESTNERYIDRVELFSSEEIHRGNFSLRLKNIQTEDKGLYICEVLHEAFSANTSVEVLQLGKLTSPW